MCLVATFWLASNIQGKKKVGQFSVGDQSTNHKITTSLKLISKYHQTIKKRRCLLLPAVHRSKTVLDNPTFDLDVYIYICVYTHTHKGLIFGICYYPIIPTPACLRPSHTAGHAAA